MSGFMRKMQRKGGLHAHWGKHVAVGLAAAGFLLSPVHARASEITKPTGQMGAITQNSGVYNIFADQKTDNAAFNVFDKFSLDSGNIANLFFRMSEGGTDANALVNILKSGKFDINGTVNAIQDYENKHVGGSLYFVSAEGITVGATGVVNAGAINLVTPTQTGVNSMFDSGNTVKNDFEPTTLLTGGMTINPSGTISVAGKLNAVDGVVMSAGKIEVVKTDPKTPSDPGAFAAIRTEDNLDFSSLVNIDGVASGMNGGTLAATPGMGGDIVLAAVATSTGKAASDQVLAAAGYKERDAKISVEQGTSISSRGGVTLSATAVNKDKSFSDIRDLNLRELNSWIPEGSNPLGEVVFLSATADVDGTITGTNVDISATTFNQYASTNDADSWSNISAQGRAASQFAQNSFGWIEKMQNTFRVTPIYSYRDSEAKVNIGEHAVLTATQAPNIVKPGSEDVLPSGISAKASATTVNVTIAATSIDSSYVNPNQHAPQPGEEEPDVTPVHRLTGATVVYAADANDVAVNIADGAKLDAQGDITVDASASDMMIGMGIVASMDPTAGQTYVDTAVVIGDAKNQAAVSVGQGASLTSSEGAVNLSAGASNSTDLGAIVAASSDSVSATAVTIYNQDSAAKVSVEGALSGKNGVSVSASDTTTRNNISANNAMMGFPPPPGAQRGANANIEQDAAQAFLQGNENAPGPVVQAVEQSALRKAKEKAEKALSLLGKYATVGASVAVANEAHTAEIALGNTAALTAENGAVSLDAKTQMNQGTNMTAMGTLMNLNPANASTAEIDAAVLVANIENDAKITVADGTADQHAVLSGTSVSVNAASEHDWGRIDGIIADYERIFNAIKTAIEDIQTTYGTLTDDEKDLVDKLAQFEKTAQDVRQAATLSVGLDLNNYVGNGVTSMPTSVMGLFEDIVSMGAAMQRIDAAKGNHYRYEIQTINQSINDFCTKFLKPENYGNFVAAATANAVGSNNNAQFNHQDNPETKLSVAGTINVNNLANRANVHIGDYTELIAAAGAADVKADTSQHSVAMNGIVNVNVNVTPLLEWVEKKLHLQTMQDSFPDIGQLIQVSDNTSGPNAFGGTVGVAVRDTESTVDVGKNASITGYASTTGSVGNGVTMQGNNDTIVTDITFGAGEAASVGVQGMVGILTGDAKSGVTVGEGSKIVAKSSDVSGRYSGIDVTGNMNNTVTNLVGAISRSNGSAAGVSVGITKFGADNTVAVSGALDAAAVNMDALTDGAVNTISVAGSISTQSREANGQQQEGDAVNPGDVVEDDAGLQNAEAQADQQAEQGAADVQQNMQDAIEHTENEEQGGNNAAALANQDPAQIPSLNLSAAGSVSVNVVDVNTEAKLDKAAVTLHQDDDGDAAKLTVKAEDASFIGAWSGAAAVTWQQRRDADGNAVLNEVAEGGANQDAANDGNPNPAGQNAAQRAQNQQNAEGNLEKGPASVGLAGAAAVNVTDQTVLSAIDHTTVTNAARVQNFAEKDGANVAAALALAVTNNESDSTTFSGAASVSYNQLANDVRARMDGSSVTGGTDTRLVNVAYDSDTQVTGGVSLDVMKGGSTSIGAGGTVALADIDNTLAAEIKGGGTYTGIGSLTDHAAIDITQVGAAAAVGVSSGATSSYSFQGAAAVNLLDNDVSAAIGDGTARTTVEAKSIDLAAYDTNGENLGKNFDRYISSMGIDATGDSYKDIAKENAATDNGGDDSVTAYDVDATSGGTVIVTGGVTLSAATGAENGVGLAGAASATTMDNDITARVENADIRATGDGTGHGLDVRADADALLIDVAAGATASGTSVSGAGSVSVQLTTNDVLAEVTDSKITADDVNLEASTESKEINVAGQLGIGKNGGGLALALNKLENSTEARLAKTDVAALETEIKNGYKEALTGSAVNVSAKNTGKVYAVGAGVGGGENAGLTGALALNFGKDNLAAVIEGDEGGTTALKNLRALSVDADNDSYRLAVAGGVQGAGKAAVGGAVAYNELGAWSSDAADPDGKQTHTASVKNVNVTTMDWDWLEKLGYTEDAVDDDKKITKTDAAIDINASDTSKLVTVGAGVGVSSGAAAVQGAAAVSRLGRVTAAEMEHMDIDADDVSGDELANRQHLNTTLSLGLDEETIKKRTAGSTLSAGASSGGSVDNVGVVVTMASHAAVGAGVAVTQTGADIKATMKDSRQTVGGGFSLTADTKDTIVDAAAGVNVAVSEELGNAAVSGSVAVNRLTGETKAEISGASELKTEGNAVVAAQSDASIDNFAGTLSVGGVGAAVGLSVSVNDIDTDTRSLVSGGEASISAGMSPASAASLANWVDNDQILNDFVNTTDTNKPSETLERSSKDYYGAVVSASSTEKINSWLGNIGGAGKGGAVDGAVNVNTISGETKAEADAASISGKEVSVIAHDYANNAAFTGSITAAGIGASVGIGVNVTKTDRDTTADLTNSKDGVKADISAEGVAVEAVQKHGLAGMDLGVTGTLEGATVGNVDDIATLSGKTAAALKNADLRLSGGDLAVTAEHETNLHTFGLTAAFVGEGGAVGVGVNVVKDGSEADASFQDSTATFAETGKTAVNVSAKNDVEDSYQLYTLSGDGIGGSAAVTVSVGNTESKTNAAMDGVTLGDADSRAKSVSVTAENKMTVKQQEWTGSVGGCGGSAGVGVNVATVDSTVGATMENSAAYSASDVTVDAKDVRDVTSLNGSTLAGIGEIGANVSVLTVGQEVDETSYSTSYQWKDEDGNTKTTTINAKEDAGANIEAAYSEAASVISDGKDASANTFGWSGGASETVLGKGGTGSAVAAKVNGSTVASGGNIKVASAEQTDVEAKQYAIGGGVAIITGSVAVADTTRNAKTDILSSTLSAGGNIELSADVSGTTDLKTVQGDGGAITINGAFSFSEASGENRLSVSDSTLDADHMVHIAAKDSSETSLSATTGSGAVGAVIGVQVAHGSMAGDTSVAMSGTTVSASGKTDGYTSMDGSGNIEAWAQNITIAAENAPTLSTKLQSGEGAAGVSVTVAVSKIQAGDEDDALNTSVSIDGSTKLLSTHAEDGQDEEKTNDAKAKDAISISAKANIKQDADMDAVDAAGGAAVGVNYGGAAVNSHVSVALGDGAAYTAEKLSVSGETALSQDIDAHGVDGAAGVGVANNAVKADNTLRTTVELGGASSSSRLAAADIAAKSGVNTTLSAQSYGGSILNVAAAEADNMLENITKANVSGKWSTTGGDFSVSATNDETLGVTVDTTDAAILDASGGSVDSETSHTAQVNLKNAVITTAGQQKYAANNNFNDKIELDASGYGGVAVGASDLRQDHSYAANVNLESATLDADGSVIASASSTGSIGTVNNVEAAGIVDATAANSKFKTTYGNTVKATDATVKTKYDVDSGDDADILFAAWDDTELSYETYGDSQGGVMGVANAIGENTLVRANTVEIGGASALESEGGLKLYASRDTSGNDADLDFKLITESINHNIVPLELKASMDSTMTQTNTVAVSNGAKAESVGDAKLAADTGYAKLTMYTDAYNLWASNEDNGTSDGPGIVTTQDGTLKDYESEANSVKIDGTLTAGVHAEAEAAISGEVTVTQATDAQGNPTGSPTYDTSGITVSVTKGGDWLKAEDFTIGTVTRENPYYERYEELRKLMGEYAGMPQYDDYKTELDSLCKTMEKAGYAQKGETSYLVFQTVTAPAVETPDLSVSGGNIYVDAESLTVNGTLHAKGDPSIKLTNSALIDLDVNDAVIQKNGGNVYFNNTGVSAGSEISGLSGAANIHADGSDDSVTPSIVIESNAARDSAKKLRADINVNDSVVNEAGSVAIENKHFDIHIGADANVVGETVRLAAENGSVYQVNPKGTVLVGSNPIQQWMVSDEVFEKIVKALHEDIANDGNGTTQVKTSFANYTQWRNYLISCGVSADDIPASQPGADDSKGILAGESVYILANSVNLGGLVQAGYGSYTATLGADAQTAVDNLDSAWQNNGSKVLTDAEVMSDSAYLVNEDAAGAKYDSGKKEWVYTPGIYYNPSTKKLLVENVSASGGNIYIEGRVSNTGGGRLRAADGASNVKVDTSAVSRDVVAYGADSTGGEGFIQIKDKLQGDDAHDAKVFEYRQRKNRSYLEGEEPGAWQSGSANFAPKDNLTYTWTAGYGETKVVSKSYTEKEYLWGLIEYESADEIEDAHSADIKIEGTKVYDNEALDSGSYLKVRDDSPESLFRIQIDYTQGKTSKSDVTEHTEETWGWGDCYKRVKYTWDETTRTGSTMTFSVSGANPVTIGFLDGGDGHIAINTGSGNTLELAGSLSAAEKGEVKITTKELEKGSGTIVANSVAIDAQTGIDAKHAALSAEDTANIDISTAAGAIDFDSTKGHLLVREASSGGDIVDGALSRVSIAAEGDIKSDATSGTAAVTANRVELASRTGAIGSETKPFAIQAGQENSAYHSVSAAAEKDIFLAQTAGDMRIDKIESASGDVALSAAGDFVDAARHEEDAVVSGTRLDRWYTQAFLSSEDAEGSRAKSGENAKEARMNGLNKRADYLGARSETKNAEDYKTEAAAFAADETMQTAQRTYLRALQAASALDGDEKTAAQKAAYDALLSARESYFEGKGYSGDEKNLIVHYAAVDVDVDNYGWSKNDVLYAVAANVMNSEPGETELRDTANIAVHGDRNIILTAGGGIGMDGEAVAISAADLDKTENRRILANARAGEVSISRDESGAITGITVQQQIPVTVSTETGGVSAMSGAQVYLATTKGETLRINGSINATGSDVRLEAGSGVVMATGGVILGKDLLIYGGAGDVGTEDAPIVTDISGTLAANSAKSVVIDQPYTRPNHNTLTVKSVAAGENILLHSANGIEMENGGTGYLNAGDTITLNAAGDIGKETAMRVLANGAAVNAEAEEGGAIRIEGMGDGNLFLGTLQAEDGTVEVTNKTGNIVLSRAEDTESGKRAVSADITAGDISLDAVTLNLTGGSLEATNANGTLSLTAANTIEQKNTETSKLAAAGEVVLTAGTTGDADEEKNAGGSISLQSTDNTFGVVNIYAADEDKGIEGNIAVVSTASDGLTANFGAGEDGTGTLAVTGGTVNVKNAKAGGDLTIGGKLTTDEDISFAGEGDLTVKTGAALTSSVGDITLSADGDAATAGALTAKNGNVKVTAKEGSIKAGGDMTAQQISLTAAGGGITVENLTATEGDVTATAKTDVTIGGLSAEKGAIAITAKDGNLTVNEGKTIKTGDGKDITLRAGKNIFLAGGMTAGGKIEATADNGDLAAAGSMSASSVTLTATNGSISVKDLAAAKGDVAATAKNNVTLDGLSAEKGAITVEATTGNLTIGDGGGIVSGTGKDIRLTAGQKMITANEADGSTLIKAGGNAILTAGGSFEAGKDVTAEAADGNVEITSVGMEAEGNIRLTASNNVSIRNLASGDGDVTANGSFFAEAGNNIIAANVTAKGDISAKAGNNATLASVKSTGGSIALTAGGDANLAGESKAAQDFTVAAGGNFNVTNNAKISAGEDFNATAAGFGTERGAIEAGANVSIESTGANLALRDITATNGNVTATAKNGSVSVANSVTAGNILEIEAGENATIAGDVDAKNIVANAETGNIKVSGNMDIDGDVTLTAEQGSLEVGYGTTLKAGHDFSATVNDYGLNAGSVVAGNNATIASTSEDLLLNNVEATNGTVTAIAAKNVLIGGATGAVTAGKDVVAVAKEGSVTVRENVEAGGAVEADGATDVTLYGTVTARDVIANAENGSVTVSGDMTTGGRISLSAKGDVKADSLSATEGGGSIAVRSETGDILLADASSRGDISVTAAKGNAVLASANSTAGNISLSAAGDAELAGNSSAAGDFNILAGGDFVVDYGTALTAGGDFNAVAHDYGFNAGSITAENNVSIESTGASLILHNVTAKSGDVTAIAANDVVLGGHAGTVEAGGDVIAVAKGGSVDVTEHIAAGETIDVTAAENVNIKSTVLESAKSISAVAQNGDVATEGAMNARGSISLAAGNRVIFDGDATAGEDISVVAGKSIEFPDAISAGRDASLKIQNGDMAAKTVVAGRDVSLQTGGRTGLEHWVEAFYPQSGSGDIYAESVTAGRDAIITAANGNITLGTVEGKNAASIFDYAPTSFMRAGTVKTDGLFTLFAWQREIGQMEVGGYFDIVLMASGDNLRKATGWDSALEAEHRMDWEYYRFHHDLLGLSRLIDIYDYWNTMPRNAEEDELLVEET